MMCSKNRNQFVDVFQRFVLKLDVEAITIAMSSLLCVFANLEGEVVGVYFGQLAEFISIQIYVRVSS